MSIHGIDAATEKAILERAKKEGKSVNKVVKDLLARALGLGERLPQRKSEFADICGIWSEKEAAEFLRNVADFEAVDPRDWK